MDNNKPKIAILISDTNAGGVALVERLLAEYIDRDKYRVFIVACGSGPFAESMGKYADEYHNLNTGSYPRLQKYKKGKYVADILGPVKLIIWFMKSIWKFTKWLGQNKIDLIHSHGSHFDFIAGISSKFVGIPSLWHIHSPQVRRWARGGGLLTKGYLGSFLATRFIAVSDFEASRYHHSWKNKVIVVSNCVDVKSITSTQRSGELRKLIKASTGEKIVGIIAVLSKRKGLERFVDMAAKVSAKRSDVKFVIIGKVIDDMSEKILLELSHKAELLGISNETSFIKNLDNASSYMSDMDTFFMCSRPYTETFGLVVLEAMVTHVPVVSFANDAIPEIIKDNRNGFLIPEADTSKASEKILELLENKSVADKIKEQAYNDVCKKFDVPVFINKIQEIYDKLLNL